MLFILIIVYITQVKISEIMYNPAGSESDNEFVEIYNSGLSSVDLNGFSISDSKGSDKLILVSGSTILAAKNYALILDATYFSSNSNQYELLIPEGISVFKTNDNTIGSGGLTNSSAETVILLDINDQIVDSITYEANYPNGFSFERQFEFGSGWGQSLTENGSPGFKNTIDIYIERLLVSSDFSRDLLRFNLTLKNTSQDQRIDQIEAIVILYKFAANSFFEMISNVSENYQINLNNGDSINIPIGIDISENGQYKIELQITNYSYINYQDSAELIIMGNQFPLIINLLRLEKPQIIRFINSSDFSFFLKSINLMGTGSWKSIPINKQLNPNDFFIISKHDSIQNAIFNDEIPNLNTVNGFLKIAIDENLDSISYHTDEIPFYVATKGLIPRFQANYNWEIDWIANPNKDQFATNSPGKFKIQVENNPFTPNGDGIADQLIFQLDYLEFDLVRIAVYSLTGRLLRTITQPEYASIGEYQWDGKDESGRLQITGPYILFFSGKNKLSGEEIVQKIPIVLIR